MPMLGRRINGRSRARVGCLSTDGDGSTVDSDVDPVGAGSDGDGATGGTIGITLGAGISL